MSQVKILIKPQFRKNLSFDEAFKINLQDDTIVDNFFMDSKECYKVFKNERFITTISWDEIPVEKQDELMEYIREFILELLDKLKYYMPLKDDYLDLFCVLEPRKFDRTSWLKLAKKLKI